MAFYLQNPMRTDIVETKFKYDSSQAMLRCNVDNYVRFLTDKLKAVTDNTNAYKRLEMVQDDPWLSDGFRRFHYQCNLFPNTSTTPGYISLPHIFHRARCDACSDDFSCSRNFDGKRMLCPECSDDGQDGKRQKVHQDPPRRNLSPSPSRAPSQTPSGGSNGSNASAVRAARARAHADGTANKPVTNNDVSDTSSGSDSE